MWSQTEDEDSDGPLTSKIHESVDNPAVRSPDASLGMHRSERAAEAVGSEGAMITAQEHFHREKHNGFKVWLTNLFTHVATKQVLMLKKHKLAEQPPHL